MFHEGVPGEIPLQPEREHRRAYVAIVRFSSSQPPSLHTLEMLLCRVKPPEVHHEWNDPVVITNIIKLLESHNYELWTIPGGGLTREEMKMKNEIHGARRAVVREAKEEVQVDIDPKNLELIAVGEVKAYAEGETPQIAHLFMIQDQHISGEPRPGKEMNAVTWMGRNEIMSIRNLEAKRAFAFVAVALFGKEILRELREDFGLPAELV